MDITGRDRLIALSASGETKWLTITPSISESTCVIIDVRTDAMKNVLSPLFCIYPFLSIDGKRGVGDNMHTIVYHNTTYLHIFGKKTNREGICSI